MNFSPGELCICTFCLNITAIYHFQCSMNRNGWGLYFKIFTWNWLNEINLEKIDNFKTKYGHNTRRRNHIKTKKQDGKILQSNLKSRKNLEKKSFKFYNQLDSIFYYFEIDVAWYYHWEKIFTCLSIGCMKF